MTGSGSREVDLRRTDGDLVLGTVAGVPVAVSTMDEAVRWVLDRCRRQAGALSIRLINAYVIVAAHRDPRYLRLVRTSGVSFPDGRPVALALRFLGHRPAARQVRGPTFFVRALAASNGDGLRHYFVGTTDETLSALAAVVRTRWPDLVIAGYHAPPFAAINDAFVEECRARIAPERPDCVWVALGTPKQDFLAAQLSDALDVTCVAVGAAFDFTAGSKAEAPRIVQALGAEWLFRFLSEPRRLWHRYVIGNVVFLLLVLRHQRSSWSTQ